MSELVLRFEHNVGRAALTTLWPDLPRDLQERLVEGAVGGDEHLRQQLAVYLHDHHPRTTHPRNRPCWRKRLPSECGRFGSAGSRIQQRDIRWAHHGRRAAGPSSDLVTMVVPC